MANSFVGSNTGGTRGNKSASASIALNAVNNAAGGTSAVQAGDHCLLTVVIGTNAGTPAINTPTGWTDKTGLLGTSNNSKMKVFERRQPTTPDTSVTISATTTDGDISISGTVEVFRGVHATTPNDVAPVVATGGSGNADPASITPTTAGTWPVACGGIGRGTAAFTNPGDLSTGTNHFATFLQGTAQPQSVSGMGFKSNWSSGAFDPAAWGGPTGAWITVTFALRPAEAPASTEETVSPAGIVSAQAFGSSTVKAGFKVSASSILTAEAVSTIAVTFGSSPSPSSISSTEGFGLPSVEFKTEVSVLAIASLAAFGSPTLNVDYVASLSSIGSGEVVGTVTAEAAFSATLGTIGDSSAVGSPTASAETFYDVTLTAIADDGGVGSPLVTAETHHTASPASITSGELFGSPTISFTTEVLATSVDSGEHLGSPTLIFEVTTPLTGIGSLESYGNVTLQAAYTATLSAIDSAEAVGSPTVFIEGQYAVEPEGIGSTVAFGIPTIQAQAGVETQPIIEYWLTDSSARERIAVGVVLDGIPSAEAFGVPTVEHEVYVEPVLEVVEEDEPEVLATVSLVGIDGQEQVSEVAVSFSYETRPYTIEHDGGIGEPEVVVNRRRRTDFEKLKQNNRLIIMALAS